MFVLRPEVLGDIKNEISEFPAPGRPGKIIHICGKFGSGKSWLIKYLANQLVKDHATDALLVHNNPVAMGNLLDLTLEMSKMFFTTGQLDSRFDPAESRAQNEKLYMAMAQLQEEHPEETRQIVGLIALSERVDLFEGLRNSSPAKLPDSDELNYLKSLPRVAAEAFIVDLMNKFYPDTEEIDRLSQLEEFGRRRITIILDNYDTMARGVSQWLAEYFWDYCFESRFEDFSIYNIQNLDPRKRVSDFFAFNFVLATRPSVASVTDLKGMDKYIDNIKQFTLEDLSPEEQHNFLEQLRINDIDRRGWINNIAYGIPFVVELGAESVKISKKGSEESDVHFAVLRSIFKYLGPHEREWVRCAAFLDQFDVYGLRCFPQIHTDAEKVLDHLKDLHDFMIESDDNFEIAEPLRSYIKRGTQIESPKLAAEYEKVASIYRSVRDLFTGLHGYEPDALRTLAYFRHFDQDKALEAAYKERKDMALDVIKKRPDYFVEHNLTKSLKKDIRRRLDQYNKLMDLDRYREKKGLIHQIWRDIEQEAGTELNTLKKERSEIQQKLNDVSREKKTKSDTFNSHNGQFKQRERHYIKELNIETKRKARSITRQSVRGYLGFVILLMIAFIVPGMIMPEESGPGAIGYFLYATAAASLVFGVICTIRASSLKNNPERPGAGQDSDDDLLKSLRSILQKLESEMNQMKDKEEKLRIRINEIDSKISDYQDILREPFV